MRINERLSVGDYLMQTLRTLDGMAWLLVCVGSVVCLLDIFVGSNLIPLRDAARPAKAIILLLFSPLLVFLILVWSRQLPFGSYRVSMWIRGGLCLMAFLIINF